MKLLNAGDSIKSSSTLSTIPDSIVVKEGLDTNKKAKLKAVQQQKFEDIGPLLSAVPTDAVFVLNIDKGMAIPSLLRDSSEYISKALGNEEIAKVPWIVSMHYSAKNSVALLYIVDLKDVQSKDITDKLLEKEKPSVRDYNGIKIYSISNNFYFAIYDKLLLSSTSPFVLESSIRHLGAKVSILDNKDFVIVMEKYKGSGMLYLNHHQVGKLFSGVVSRDFLKYSDFFMRFSQWSALNIELKDQQSCISGYSLSNNDLKNYASLFNSQKAESSEFAEILPAETVFALSLNITSIKDYIKSLSLFMEVHKKLSSYNLKQALVSKDINISPYRLVDSIKIKSITSAYCKFGDSYHWINFIKLKPKGFLGKLKERLFGKDSAVVKNYPYGGYLESVFGDIFSHCKEECYCVVNDCWVIGPKKIVKEFASEDAFYYSLADYLKQSPASGFLSEKSSAKLFVNILEAKDSVAAIFKNPLKSELLNEVKDNNFQVLTMDIISLDDDVRSEINIFGAKLKTPPMPKVRERKDGKSGFTSDSVINIPKGPYSVIDFVNGGYCYLQQQKNFKLSYLNSKKKGVWTADFKSPICGMVSQADLFKNEKLQMIFVSGSKVYALDRLGRFVGGFPVQLKKEVVLGPFVVDLKGDKDYSIIVLNLDNTISWYNLRTGEPMPEWKDIKCSEFIKGLPSFIKVNEKWYLALRGGISLRIYDLSGREVVTDNKNRTISALSSIRKGVGNEIVVRGIDGKNFVMNLATGKTKKY